MPNIQFSSLVLQKLRWGHLRESVSDAVHSFYSDPKHSEHSEPSNEMGVTAGSGHFS